MGNPKDSWGYKGLNRRHKNYQKATHPKSRGVAENRPNAQKRSSPS